MISSSKCIKIRLWPEICPIPLWGSFDRLTVGRLGVEKSGCGTEFYQHPRFQWLLGLR